MNRIDYLAHMKYSTTLHLFLPSRMAGYNIKVCEYRINSFHYLYVLRETVILPHLDYLG